MIWLALLWGCTDDTDLPPPPGTDTGTTADSGVPAGCEDLPHVTYENWAWGFLTTYCQGCHASTAPDRYGAPEGVSFDDEAEALAWADRIEVRTLTQQDMPPAGGVPSEELEILGWWLDCGL